MGYQSWEMGHRRYDEADNRHVSKVAKSRGFRVQFLYASARACATKAPCLTSEIQATSLGLF